MTKTFIAALAVVTGLSAGVCLAQEGGAVRLPDAGPDVLLKIDEETEVDDNGGVASNIGSSFRGNNLELLLTNDVSQNAAPPAALRLDGELSYKGGTAPVQLNEDGVWFSRIDDNAVMLKIEERGGEYVAVVAVASSGRIIEHPAETLQLGRTNRLNIRGGIRFNLTPTVQR